MKETILVSILSIFCVSGYIFVEEPKTFLEAVAHCRAQDMELLAIRTNEQVESTIKTMQTVGVRIIWIGITRMHIESDAQPWDWRYIRDNETLTRDDLWMAGDPDNYQNNERCVEIVISEPQYDTTILKRLNDDDCDLKRGFICEPKNKAN